MTTIPKKGILESIPEFFQIIVAIAIALILIVITFHFFASQNQGNNIEVKGNVDQVSSRVAQYLSNCWNDHRQGLDSVSAICFTVKINTATPITEKNVTKFLDCGTIPDNNCTPDDCSKCTSSRYPDNSQDKLIWNFDNSTQYVEISYLGANRSLKVSNAFPPQ